MWLVRYGAVHLCWILAASWPAPSFAQATERVIANPAAVRVSRADAIRWGAARGPGISAARAPATSVREARGAATRFLRAPLLTFTGGYRTGPTTGGPELGVSVSQELPLEDVGARRRELASAWNEQTFHELRQAELEAAARAALAWTFCIEAEAIRGLRLSAVIWVERIERLSQIRVAAGTALPSDEALARSDGATARAAVLEAEGRVVEAYAELRFAIGQRADARLAAVGELGPIEPPPTVFTEVSRAARRLNPALEGAKARARLAHEQTRLVVASLGPSLTVGASYLREGGGIQVLTGFVGLPLPFVDPAGFDAARQRGLEQRARAEITQTEHELEMNESLAAHERKHWREVHEGLKAGAEAAREALRITLAHFEVGTHDISSVLLARQRVAAAEEQAAHAAGEILRADIRFQALTGRLLEANSP